MSAPTAPLGFYWGDDAYSIARAPGALAKRIAAGGEPLDRVLLTGRETTADEIAEKVATATMFGGGTLVVVAEPAPLISTRPLAARLHEALAAVADGNGLAFTDLVDNNQAYRRPASLKTLREAVAAAGGEVREFKAPKQEEMAAWIGARANERGIRITTAAASLLARRVGAFVREGDVDRRRQGELAVSELEKLAVYRLDGPIGPEDVKALVADAVPGSMWAFLDGVGARDAADAARLAELLDDIPGPVLVVQLHKRLRELIEIGELLSQGTPAAALVRTLKLNPYRAERLAQQARAWRLEELEGALSGLLDLDRAIKGPGGETLQRSEITLWIAEHVRRETA